jgi:ribose-phosphate pyrophosphokinase
MKLFSGTSNAPFSQLVADHLQCPLSKANIGRFSDGEVKLLIDDNVRGEDCFIIQPTSRSICDENDVPYCGSVNDNLMELFILTDAIKRGSAKSVNLVIPYFGYQRQDRKDYSRAPISAAVVARFIETLNVNRVMMFDLHAGQIAGFFSNNCPVDNLYAEPYFIKYIKKHELDNLVFVAPDAGAMKTNYRVAQKFGVPTCSIFKNRTNGIIDHMMLIGDVEGKNVIMIDDMIDTGGTICKAANLLKENGAKSIYIFVTHGLFSGNALENIEKSAIDKVVVTNTVPNKPDIFGESTKIDMIDVSWMCAEAITRLMNGESISHLYSDYEFFLKSTTPSPNISPHSSIYNL